MANEENTEETESAGKGAGKGKLMLFASAGLLTLVLAGGAAYWFLLREDPAAELVDEGAVEEAIDGQPSESRGRAIYHKLQPEFITTFDANNRQRYVQIEVTLVTRNENTLDVLNDHNPPIRNALVMLFASQDYVELQSLEGKNALKKATTRAIQKIVQAADDEAAVDTVLFTKFVMQ